MKDLIICFTGGNVAGLLKILLIYTVIPISFISFTSNAHAQLEVKECEVDGISDGPQQLDCSFGKVQLDLRCQKGQYHLNNLPVTEAFHLEVESGPTPLVFRFLKGELTVFIKLRSKVGAKLTLDNKISRGYCRL